MTKTNFLILTISLLTIACNSDKKTISHKIAEVGSKTLELDQIKDLIPDKLSKEDSTVYADNYIRQWVKKQLLLSKAEENLSKTQNNIEKLVSDYRSSLIIHQYQQGLLSQNLDTIVKDSDIDKYYKDYTDNFVLARNIVKAVYMKISKDAPNIKKIRNLYKSNKEEDFDEMESYCFSHATKYDSFNQEWIYADELFKLIPSKISNQEHFIRKNKYYECEDASFYYFIKILKYKIKDSYSPIEFIRDDIRKIIINKRKIEYIKNLEENIFSDAEKKNKFKIY
ncbi:MAG: hypothetical protein N4A49_01330 [Marinifilaceae bacterium]|jgi:hypothetical protein|nr:hypothetical protein [Marinifilaceae bacterium]